MRCIWLVQCDLRELSTDARATCSQGSLKAGIFCRGGGGKVGAWLRRIAYSVTTIKIYNLYCCHIRNMTQNCGGGFGAYLTPITYRQILVSLQKWHRLLHRHSFMTVKLLRCDLNDIMHVSFNQNLSQLTLIHS